MQQLGAQDALFLALERAYQPMTCHVVGILEAGNDGTHRPVTLDDLAAQVEPALDRIPSMRWTLVPHRLGLRRPFVVDGGRPDLDRHLSRRAVAPPGDAAAFDHLIAHLAEEPLDRTRPLWRLVLVDGLADGRQAFVLSLHHAITDGMAVRALVRDLLEPPPGPADRPPTATTATPRPTPPKAAPPFGTLVAATVRGLRAARSFSREHPGAVPRVGIGVPACVLNDAFTIGRSFGRATISGDQFASVRKAVGGTVADAILILVAGALRRVLEARGALPEGPLVVTVPVALDVDPGRQHGNLLSTMNAYLATDVADPVERARRVRTSARLAKQHLIVLGRSLLRDWIERSPHVVGVTVASTHGLLRSRLRAAADANVLVSTLPGPSERLRVAGREVVEAYGLGPPANGVGVNIVAGSYAGQLSVSVLAFADAVDARALAAAIAEEASSLPAAFAPAPSFATS